MIALHEEAIRPGKYIMRIAMTAQKADCAGWPELNFRKCGKSLVLL